MRIRSTVPLLVLLFWYGGAAAAQKQVAPAPLPEIELPEVELPSGTTRTVYPIHFPSELTDPYRRFGECHELRSWTHGGHSYSFDVPPQVRNYAEFRDLVYDRAARAGILPPSEPLTVYLFLTSEGAVTRLRLQRSSGSDTWDQIVLSALPVLRFHPARQNVGGAIPTWLCRSVEFGN